MVKNTMISEVGKAIGRRFVGKNIGKRIPVCFSLFIFLLFIIDFSLPAYGAGGDIVPPYPYFDARSGKQEPKAMAVDSIGNTILTGYQLTGGTNNDYYTIKVKADGSEVAWSALYDRSGKDDQAVAVAVDSDNNVVVTGFAQIGSSFDFHTIKYSGETGTVLWQKTFNGSANGNDEPAAVAVDSVNNVYIGGHTQNASGDDDYIILKYNANGDLLWQQQFNGPANGQDRVTAIAAGTDSVALAGYSWNGTDFDLVTINYNSAGAQLWNKRYSTTGTGDDRAVAAGMDSAGNVVVAGYASNSTDMDVYTVKYSAANGTVLWEVTFNGGYNDEPKALWIGAADNVYVTGYSWTLNGHYDFYTARYNGSTGAQLWEKSFNSGTDNDDIAIGVVVDASGDVFVTGYTTSSGNYDFQTIKYEKNNGNQLWQKNYDGAAGRNDRPAGIGLAAAGEVIVGGWSDAWTGGSSDYDYCALKYDPGLLNAPSDLSAETITNTEIRLDWADNSLNEDGFRIERKIGELGDFSEITTVGADISEYSDTGLDPDTKYFYRVRAYNAANGNSYYSNEAHALTTIVSYAPPSWSYIYDGAGSDDYAMAVATGPDNHPVITGYSFSAAGAFDYYTVKMNRSDGSLSWSARYDDPDNATDAAMTLSIDRNNEVVVSGFASLHNPARGENTNDVYTIKYDISGDELWHDQYDGPVNDDDRSTAVATAADGSNSIVVAGYGRNASFNDDIYVIKYLATGARAWVATPFDRGGNDYPSALVIDPSNNIIITGYSYNGADYDFFTRKYDGSGNVLWTDIFDSTYGNDEARALAVDLNGNVYVTGYVMNSSGNQDFYTIKYDGATGARTWERPFAGLAAGNDEAKAVRVDPIDGDIVVSGTTRAGAEDNDFHIIRYDSGGNVVWEKTLYRPLNDDYVSAMGMDLSGNVCVAGTTNNGANMDIMSIKYFYDGSIMGSTIFNGTANGHDEASGVAVNALGEAFIAGYTTNSGGNVDYVLYKCAWDSIQVPAPFNVTPGYTEADLSWADNATDEDGYYVERKTGSCSSGSPWVLIYTAAQDFTTYMDTELNPGSEYCYRMQTFKNNGEASRWIEKAVTTLTPAVPGSLGAIAANTTQIDLSWTDNTTGEDGFRIERCQGVGCDFSVKETFTTGPGVSGVQSYQDTAACNATTYSYRVIAYKNGSWESAPSAVATAVTPGLPSAPVLSVARASEIRIDLSWTYGPPDDKTGFKIERCRDQGSGCSDFAEIAQVGAVNSYEDYTVLSSETYVYRIRAYKTTAFCSWNGDYSLTETAASTVSPPVITAASPNTTEVDLSWTDTTSSETGFKLERCEAASCTYSDVANLGMSVSEYADTTVCNATSYLYRVTAFKEGLSAPGAGCWTKRFPLTITNFQPDYQTKLLISHTADMLGNFEDIRFYDAATGYELPYWIEEINTGVNPKQATVWVKTGGNNNIYMYYGNAGAVSGSSSSATFIREIDQLKGAWKFDENTGTTANDFSGNANTLTLINSPVWTTGKFGSALSFNGSNSYARRTSGTSLPLGNSSRTFMAWIKPTGYPDPTYNGIVAYGNTLASQGSLLSIKNDARLSMAFWNNDAYQTSGDQAVLNEWNHVAFTYNSSNNTVRFYVNGSFTSESAVSTPNTTDGYIRIGSTDLGGRVFQGAIDEVRIFGKVLSDEDISDYAGNYGYITSAYPGRELLRRYASIEPSVVTGTEESPGGCYTFTGGWSSISNEVPVTTPAPVAPALTSGGVKRSSEKEIDLTWTRNTTDETGFEIDRCSGVGCDFSSKETFIVGPGITSYADTAVVTGQIYTYRVRAYKTTTCSWYSDYSSAYSASTDILAPDTLTATAQDTTTVKLFWSEYNITETGFEIWRCLNTGGPQCTDYANIGTAGVNSITYADPTVCNGSSYNYEIRSFKNNLSFPGTGSWSTRVPLTINSFQPDYQTKVTVSYKTAMKNDFADLRFYDETVGAELSYWIESKAEGVSATIWVRTGANNAIKMYYGNPDAASASNAVTTFDFFDDFRGSVIDAVKWTEIDPVNSISQNNDLVLSNASSGWTKALISNQSFSRIPNRRLYVSFSTLASTGSDYMELGWGEDQTTDPNYTRILYGLYFNNYSYFVAYEKGAWQNSTSAYAQNTDYEMRIDLKTTGAITAVKGGSWANWTTVKDSANFTDSPLRIALAHYTHPLRVHQIRAQKYATAEPSVSVGTTEEQGFTISGNWTTTYANTSVAPSVTTPATVAPDSLVATPVSSTGINLSWSYSSVDYTGFEIWRCPDAAVNCTTDENFGLTPIGMVTASGVKTYSDTGLISGNTYTYRVRAYKTASCPWWSGWSNTQSATTTNITPDTLVATPSNTTRVSLSWNDRTMDETGFVLDRCEGVGCDFSAKTSLNIRPNNDGTASSQDDTVCKSTTYQYRVKANGDGLIFGNGGSWAKRVPLNITGFQPDYQTKLTVDLDAEMQSNFGDIRFYDVTAAVALPYWIENVDTTVNPNQATVWVKTGVNNNIYMYYGNPSAADASGGDETFEFFDDFKGYSINTTKWTEIDPNNSISQNNDLILKYVNAAWSKALISNTKFTRSSDKRLYVKLSTLASSGSDYVMIGWEADQNSSANYNQLIHGLYFNNYSNVLAYEKGSNRGSNIAGYAASTDYEMRIDLNTIGAAYYIKGGTYGNWTTVKTTSIYSDTPMRVAFTQQTHPMKVHLIRVQKFAATEPAASFGTVEAGPYAFSTWSSPYSNTASVTTGTPVAPGSFSASRITETQINLYWSYGSSDYTGFEIWRCPNTAANCTTDTDFNTKWFVNAGVTNYSDTNGLTGNHTYTYRIRAYKTASCSWNSNWSATASATTTVTAPVVTTVAANTTQVNLSWTNSTSSESGFKVERCQGTTGSCLLDAQFSLLYTADPNITVYNDTTVCQGTAYTYRVRAYNPAWGSDSVSSKVGRTLPAAVRPGPISAAAYSDARIDLAWTNNTTDETDIYLERCSGAGCSDFTLVGTLSAGTAYYPDTPLSEWTSYSYRIMAHKESVCSWNTAYSDVVTATTTILGPTGMTASAINSRKILLNWADNEITYAEDGFEVEVQVWNGRWTLIATVGPNVTTYTDTQGIEPLNTYTYRVRAYKGDSRTLYTSSPPVTTPAFTDNDNTCQ
jgi:uncharacterized delta-60 repeat protein